MPHKAMTNPTVEETSDRPKLFDGFWKNVSDSYSGTNILFHLGGVASTVIIIESGYDAHVHQTFKHSQNEASWPGAVIGSGLAAVTAGSFLYFSENKETVGAACVIAQAALITVSHVSLLKAITGRTHPTNSSHLISQEQSEDFQFGFMRGGVSYGWPSGHMSHTVAITSALSHYYPSKTWLPWMAVGLSSYMLYTVSSHSAGQMHWFSDGVAGAFMGYAIGSTVGKNFRHQIDGTTETTSKFNWMPIASNGFIGMLSTVNF